MEPFLERADQNEQGAGAEAVRQYLDDRTLQRQRVPCIDAEQDEAQMADAGIGNQAFHVVLGEGEHRAIKNTDDAECHGDRREGGGRLGEERDGEAQQAIGAGLQEQAGENDAAGGRRLGVGIGQPGVEWHGRQLDGEGDEEAEHDPHLRCRVEPDTRQREVIKRQGPGLVVVAEG